MLLLSRSWGTVDDVLTRGEVVLRPMATVPVLCKLMWIHVRPLGRLHGSLKLVADPTAHLRTFVPRGQGINRENPLCQSASAFFGKANAQPRRPRGNSFLRFDTLREYVPPLIIETNRNGELYLHALHRVSTLSYIFRREIRFNAPCVLIYVLLLAANLPLMYVDYSRARHGRL